MACLSLQWQEHRTPLIPDSHFGRLPTRGCQSKVPTGSANLLLLPGSSSRQLLPGLLFCIVGIGVLRQQRAAKRTGAGGESGGECNASALNRESEGGGPNIRPLIASARTIDMFAALSSEYAILERLCANTCSAISFATDGLNLPAHCARVNDDLQREHTTLRDCERRGPRAPSLFIWVGFHFVRRQVDFN